MRIDWDNSRPITAAIHHLHSGMVYDGSLKKSLACLQQTLVIRWAPECFVEVDAGIDRAITQITNIIIKRRRYATTTWEGYQKASLDTSERMECLRHVFGTDVGDDRGKSV